MSRQSIRDLSPGQREHRRRRERVNQQRRRARLSGKTITEETLTRLSVRLTSPPPAWELPAEPACAGADPGLFFGPEHESPQARALRTAKAQSYCAGCPVSRECLQGAEDRRERYGIWGGTDFEAGRHALPAQATRPSVAAPGRA